MSLTWGQIRKYVIEAAGGPGAVQEEVWDHVTEGYRFVATHPAVEVPELSAIDELLTVTSGQDRVAISSIDFDVFAIQSVFNLTSGYILYPDPGGMLGRERYLQTTGKPPSGSITNYTRDGAYLYVRNTPTADTSLRVRVLRQVPAIGDADINSSPITPAQYDWAIIHAATANFYKIHPRYASTQDGSQGESFADRFSRMAEQAIGTPKPTEREQDRVRKETWMLRGYSLQPRSARRFR